MTGSKPNLQPIHIAVLIIAFLFVLPTLSFPFKELNVSASSTVTNVTATYTVLYQTFQINSLGGTAWNTTFYPPTSNVTLSFPVQYALPSTITCSYSINSTGSFTSNPCTLSGTTITLNNLFNNTIVRTFTLIVTGVLNPFPAGNTGNFTGTIGDNNAVPNNLRSVVTIIAATKLCSFTFQPNFVYLDSANMVFTLTITNQFPQGGSITVRFPNTRYWSQDLNTSRTFPINTSMVCNNASAVTPL